MAHGDVAVASFGIRKTLVNLEIKSMYTVQIVAACKKENIYNRNGRNWQRPVQYDQQCKLSV